MRVLSAMEKRISRLEKFADSMKAQLGGKPARRRRRSKPRRKKAVKKAAVAEPVPRPKKRPAKKAKAKTGGKRDLRKVPVADDNE